MILEISLFQLAIAFIPALVAIIILWLWSQNYKSAIHAVIRMSLQLLMVGYFLNYLFSSDNSWIIVLVLSIMIIVSSWIALHGITEHRVALYQYTFIAILFGGGSTLILVTQGVLAIDPWYAPHYIIPMAGMIFSSSMTSVSLAAERYFAERPRVATYLEARNIAFQASMIPIINTLFAVGIVSLPGMMTGQILSGVSPLIAVRYQMMVMSMIFGASTIAVIIFLILLKHLENKK
ncbi:MAG: ABC transporter permease [Thiotrichaceae bacterium]|nr:ABC transporter permease [Thiotrichaceae bacterium]